MKRPPRSTRGGIVHPYRPFLEWVENQTLPAATSGLGALKRWWQKSFLPTRPPIVRTASRRPVQRSYPLAVEQLEYRLVPALNTLTWTDIGPGSSTLTSGQVEAPISNGQVPGGGAVSGRVTGIATDPTNPNSIYIATAGGGVWQTTDGGNNWKPLTDSVSDSTPAANPVPEFIGAIAIAPSSPPASRVIYAGTGEANNNVDGYAGEGILVSTKGGAPGTWTLTGQATFAGLAISRIVVDPMNPGTAYAAVSNGAVNSTGIAPGLTGIYKTTTFGAAWTNVTNLNTIPGVGPAPLDSIDPWSDLVIDPTTSGGSAVLFAAVGNQIGSAGNAVFPGNGVYTSVNGGLNWSPAPIGGGLPSGAGVGRISLALAHLPGTSAVLYASIATPAKGPAATNATLLGLFQSTTGGSSWTNITPNLKGDDYLKGKTPGQGWYDNVVAIDPQNTSRVFVAGVLRNQGGSAGFTVGGIEESTDGGTTWSEVNTDSLAIGPVFAQEINGNGPHTDYHALAFDASDQLVVGNDGGVWRLGPNNVWTDLNNNLEITQFYGISPSAATSTVLFGGSQDNGTEEFNGTPTWPRQLSGDGGTTVIDPNFPNRVYALTLGPPPVLNLSTNVGASFSSSINAGILTFSTATPRNINFDPSYALDTAGDVFFGTDEVNLCTNPTAKSPTWTQIGIPGTNGFNPGDSKINAIAVDPNDTTNKGADGNVVYVSAGTQLFVTKNAQAGAASVTWTAIDGTVAGNGWPAGFVVGGVAAGNGLGDPSSLAVPAGAAPGTAFAVGAGTVIMTTNYGTSWTPITGTGLPPNEAIDSVAALPGFGVFVGTDVGVYSTTSITMTAAATTITAPITWSPYKAGLPNAQVTDLVAAQYPDVGTVLAAGTHGRGVWEILLTAGPVGPPITGYTAAKQTFEDTNGDTGPALATLNGTTFIGWTGRNNRQLVITPLHADGTPIEPNGTPEFISPPQLTSNTGLALATLNNQMFVAFTGVNDHQLLIAPVNVSGSTISLGTLAFLNQFSDSAPALGVFNGNLYIAWTGQGDNDLNFMELNTNGGISPAQAPFTPSLTATGSPALAAAFGQFWVGFTGKTNDLFVAPLIVNNANGNVTGVQPVQKLSPQTSDFGPALANLNGQLYIGWTGQGNPAVGLSHQALNVMQILANGSAGGPPSTDQNNTSNTQLALGVVNGTPVISWTGVGTSVGGDNQLNVEFLGTSVRGVVLTPQNQTLTITGDQDGSNQADFVVLGSQAGGVQVTMSSGGPNGVGIVESFPAGAVNSVVIQPRGGNNTVVVDAVPAGVAVTVQSTGSDYIDVGNGSLAGVQGTVTAQGTGQDFLQLDDSRDTASSSATLNAGALDFNGTSSLVSWSGLQDLAGLNYNGGQGGDTVNVLATAVPTAVVGGDGADVFNVGATMPGASSGTLANLAGPLTVAGGPGPRARNRLFISDAADGNADTVTETAVAGAGGGASDSVDQGSDAPSDNGTLTFHSALLPAGGAVISFGGVFTDPTGAPDGISVWGSNAASASNVYNVQGTPFDDTTQLNGGGGSDTFNVSDDAPTNAGVLEGIQGAVSLIGGPGSGNQLNVSDTGSSGPKTGTLTPTTLTGLGMGPGGVTYAGMAALNVSLGSGGNTFAVHDINAATATTVHGGSSANDGLTATFAADFNGRLVVTDFERSGIQVTRDLNGFLSDTLPGSVQAVTIGRSLTATGTLLAGSIDTLSVGQDVAGRVQVLGNLGSATVGGSVAGSMTVGGNAGSVSVGLDVSGSIQVTGSLNTLMVGEDVSGSVNVGGDLGTATISRTVSGTIVVVGQVTSLAVGQDVSGLVQVSGSLGSATVGGSVAGSMTVGGNAGSVGVGLDISGSIQVTGSLNTLMVSEDISGLVNVGGDLGTATVGRTVSGTILVGGQVTTLSVGQDVSGFVQVSGNLGSATIGGSVSGSIDVGGNANTMSVGQDVSGVVQVAGNLNTLTVGHDVSGQVTVGGALSFLTIGNNLSGTVRETGTMQSVAIGGSLTYTGLLSAVNAGNPDAANIVFMTIGPNFYSPGHDLAGTLIVSGTLFKLRVAGGTPGTIQAGHIGAICVYGGFGPLVLRITDGGVQRRVEAAVPSNPYPLPAPPPAPPPPVSPAGVRFQYVYESAGLTSPQWTARVFNTASTSPDQYDLSLVTWSDTAQFNLARLDANGVAGIRNVAVEGDVLTGITTGAASFFGLPANAPGGVALPQDNLAGVGVRGYLPNGFVQAASIQALAFGAHSEEDGTVENGAQANAEDGEDALAPGTAIAQPRNPETFRVPFADALPVAFFFDSNPNNHHFDSKGVVFADQVANDHRGAVTALVAVAVPADARGNPQAAAIQRIDLRGDGGAIQTQQPITTEITSTGPLGDLTLQAPGGIVADVTAPSILGSIDAGSGPIAGTIQTTGLRLEPTTGQTAPVPATFGRVITVQTPNGPVLTTTTVHAAGGGITGRLISRGDFLSQVTADGGISGLIAAQGNLGATSGAARLGGILSNGPVRGQVLALGAVLGDVTVHGALQGGRIAARGSILGNLTIDGGIDAAGALVTAGSIGNAAAGTALQLGGSVKGILAAVGSIAFGQQPNVQGAAFFGTNLGATDPVSTEAIDALFAPAFDINPLDLGGLNHMLAELASLQMQGGKLKVA